MKRISAFLIVACLLISVTPLNVSADETKDIPANAQETGDHESLVAALTKADLVTALQAEGPFTVFAPTDAAFTAAGIDLNDFETDEEIAVLANILTYHVYSGSVASSAVTDGLTVTMLNGDDATFTVVDSTVKIGDATVTTPDVTASNGIIHVIDTVLMPPVALDIPATAQSTGVHDSLVAALTKANLVTALQAEGPFTVFAPTDAAFTAAGIDLDTFVTDEEIAALADILTYHVYSGSVASSAVTDGLTVTMLNGDDATFTVVDNTVKIGDATVTTPDVTASNGIIHVIDTVLTPPADTPAEPTLDIPATAQSTGVHDSLVAALTKANLVTALQAEGPFTVFAPTDAAFTEAGIDLDTFVTDEEIAALADILTYHVYSGAVPSTAVTDGLAVTMLNGDKATFTVADGAVSVGGATVTGADVQTTNGIIHVIDKVLTPPPGDICYNMVSHTIVAGATNFECNSYMYLENYSMNGQTITGCYNTVTHAVSAVSEAVCGAYMWTPAVNIAMTAGATTIHTSLVAALAAANLVDTLSGTDDYTVFAPTDEAFAAAGINLDDFTTDAEIAVLADILLYHVVAGTTMSTDLADGVNTVTAANGDALDITVSSTGVAVGAAGAAVVLADVPASNGVIHVIDAVLTPPADPTPDPFEGIDCAATIGVGATGYAFTPDVVTIAVGETVCWSWEDESMPHNVKEITGYKSTNFVEGGVTSGAAASTVNFHYTFTEDTTFFYACEPHVALNMFGEVVVGDGGQDDATSTVDSDDEENTPGFMVISTLIAVIGALALMGRTSRDE